MHSPRPDAKTNINKSVVSFLRQLSTWHCPHSLLRPRVACGAAVAGQQSIDISCPPGAQLQTRRTLLQRSIDGTDRQTDGRTKLEVNGKLREAECLRMHAVRTCCHSLGSSDGGRSLMPTIALVHDCILYAAYA